MKKILLLLLLLTTVANATTIETEKYVIEVDKIFSNIERPWGFDFLSEQQIILTEKAGKLYRLDLVTKQKQEIQGAPKVYSGGWAGLLDVLVDPNFSQNNTIYLTYTHTHADNGKYSTALMKAKLVGNQLTQSKQLFKTDAPSSSVRHLGSRVRMAADGYLYFSHGDRGNRRQSQNLNNHIGTILRIDTNGHIPQDNPFVDDENAQAAIFSYGHRNPQGMTIHPISGDIWISDHGARGGDEVNIIESGANYGWPVISYGRHYSGQKIGEGTHKEGMKQPIHYWDPSIAPSGITFYNGKLFPEWSNNLFTASLKFGLISRLSTQRETVVAEESIFHGQFGRIRDIKQAPDGTLIFVTDESNGGVYQIRPK